MEYPGIEPGAFCMRGKRDTTTPISLHYYFEVFILIDQNYLT